MPEQKVYVVNVAFESNGFTYAAGEKYQLEDVVVQNLAEGTVTEFVPETTTPAETPSTEPGTGAAAEGSESTPATPWVGGHSMADN